MSIAPMSARRLRLSMFDARLPRGCDLGLDPLKPNLDPDNLFKGPLGLDFKGLPLLNGLAILVSFIHNWVLC